MPSTYFHLYKLTVEPRADSVYTTFTELLNNPPVKPITLAKKGNPFQLEDKINKKNDIYTGTFCLIQKNELPPKAQFGKKPEKILDDEDDGGLGHYTSFVYDSSNEVIAIQSNRNGINANELAAYFRRNYKVKEIILEIIINPDKLEELNRMTKISSFEVSIAKPQNGSFIGSGSKGKKSIDEINKIADDTNASVVRLSLGIGYSKDSSLKRSSILSYVRNLLSKTQHIDVKKIEVKGKEADNNHIEVLDLVTNKVVIEVKYTAPRSMSPGFLSYILNKVVDEYTNLKPRLDKVYKVKRK